MTPTSSSIATGNNETLHRSLVSLEWSTRSLVTLTGGMLSEAVRRDRSSDEFAEPDGRRILGVYAALGSGPFELIGAAFGRLIEKTRRAPEPIRRILWGQRR